MPQLFSAVCTPSCLHIAWYTVLYMHIVHCMCLCTYVHYVNSFDYSIFHHLGISSDPNRISTDPGNQLHWENAGKTTSVHPDSCITQKSGYLYKTFWQIWFFLLDQIQCILLWIMWALPWGEYSGAFAEFNAGTKIKKWNFVPSFHPF